MCEECLFVYISLQIIQLLEGKASAYVFASPGCKKWDTCAPEAILRAVGGRNYTFFSSTGCCNMHKCFCKLQIKRFWARLVYSYATLGYYSRINFLHNA